MAKMTFPEWAPQRTGFPTSDRAAQIRFLLRFAILAPSGHNAQPWRYEIDHESGSLLINLEWSRVLRVSDPNDRITFMALGTTARNFVRAAECYGLAADAQIVGEGTESYVRVTLTDARDDAEPSTDWIDAITRRISNRSNFYKEELSEPLKARLTDFEVAGVEVRTYTSADDKRALAHLTSISSKKLINSKTFRGELAQHVHPNTTTKRTGMPASGQGIPGPISPLAPFVVRHAKIGTWFSIKDRKQLTDAPMIVVLITPGDAPHDWIRAGMAHEELFLRTTSERLALDTFAAATCDDDSRARLAKRLEVDGYPQILVRTGRAKKQNRPHTPRLRIDDVFTEAPAV
ncbi:Acg family FMN-binding oxidoreductase [Streptomyces justiciae]|uniref:Acg family FMN-binding oxidoreductase n=1 Tax=Streptomyces justiciae TaxID=2780140 RepID=UPI001880BB31|nr:hypothetical protein [Streptomyces justiciae]MBE8477388.1 hypothetical protein [Streptomyces justiciae]